MKFDKITCYSILGENVQSCEVTVCSQKLLLLNKTKEVTKTSLFQLFQVT